MSRRAIVRAAALSGFLFAFVWSPMATAATYNWINPSGGSWNVASNWSPAAVPTASDVAIIDACCSYQITLPGDVTVGAMTLGGGGLANPTLITNGFTLTLNGDSLVAYGSTLVITNGGGVSVASGKTFTMNGTCNWVGPSSISGGGTFAIAAGADLWIRDDTGGGDRTIDNATLSVSGGIEWFGVDDIAIANNGRLIMNSGSQFLAWNDQRIHAGCVCPTQPVTNNGLFQKRDSTGTTRIDDIGFVNGFVMEVLSGTVLVNSPFSESGNPRYSFGVDSQTGLLQFAAPVNLTGMLFASPVNGFVPQGGAQYPIISYPAGSSASFTTKNLSFGSGRSFTDSYTSTGVTLTSSGPTITSLTPNNGTVDGGTNVTISGTGFVAGGSLAVTFGGSSATSVVLVDANTVTCTTPAHSLGAVDVGLTNGDGQPTTLASGYTYMPRDNDLTLDAMASPPSLTAGQTFTLTSTLHNNGPFSANNAYVTTTLPAGVEFVSGTLTLGSCSYSAPDVQCYIDGLSVGQNATMTLTLLATGSGTLTLSPTVSADESDSNTANNSPTASVTSTGASSPLIVTSNVDDTSVGSLRNAIYVANGGGCPSPCTIAFNIGGGGPQSIVINSALPPITATGTVIDGTTQPSYAGKPLIRLDKGGVESYYSGLELSGSGGITVKALSITSFNSDGIDIAAGSNGNQIRGCYIGVALDGTAAGNSYAGMYISNAANNVVGGAAASDRNVISANGSAGIEISGTASTGNVIAGNYVGTNIDATAAMGNSDGISLYEGASSNTIGASAGNVISGNQGDGIYIEGSSGATDVSTLSANPAATTNGSNRTARRAGPERRNARAAKRLSDRHVRDTARLAMFGPLYSSNNTISGNFIGTDAAGNSAIANLQNGVDIDWYANGNTITNNVVSGNNWTGIEMSGPTNGNSVLSNHIGTNLAGSAVLGNGDDGIFLDSNVTNTQISGNVIGGHSEAGIALWSSGTTGTVITGNFIGTDTTGSVSLPNYSGIAIGGSNGGSVIGTSASPNVIAFNTYGGIVFQYAGAGTAIRGNSIYSNAGLGIDLNSTQTSVPNDAGDGDNLGVDTAASNNYQNTPVINSVLLSGSSLTANLNVDSSGVGSTGSICVDLYRADGSGQGKQWLGAQCFAGNNLSSVTVTVPAGAITAGSAITSTATSYADAASSTINDGTSEFSATAAAACGPGAVTVTPSGATTFCAGGSVTLTATAGYAGYLWSTGATTPSIIVSASGSYSVNATTAAGCTEASSPVSVTVNPPPAAPVITPSGSTTFCAGGSVTLTAPGGFTYLWSNSATTPSITVTTGGSYSVTVTDANGCSATSAATAVTVNTPPPTPLITAGGPTTFCTGGSVTLTAPAGYTYLWSNGATTQAITVSASGNYSVTVTDANSCSATSAAKTVTVNTPPPTPLIAAGGSTTFCAGGSVTLTAPAGYTYQWSNSATTQAITVTATGNYSVTVFDANGCSATSAAKAVTVNPAPAMPVVSASGPTTFCSGGSVTLTAPAGFVSYSWSNGASTQAITATAGGSYSVTVFDSNGCSATSATTTVTVNPTPATPVITASGPTTFCAGGSVTLTAPSGGLYSWSTGATTQSITVTAAGSYSVTMANTFGCSSTSAPTTVTVNPAPSTPVVTASGATTFCAGGSVTLTAPAGSASYVWSTGATTQAITVTTTGSYSVTVFDATGCSSTSAPIAVTANAAPATPTVTASGPTTFCAGGSVTLTAPAGFAYAWSNGATTQSISVTTSGSYSVTVTNASGCSATSSSTNVTVAVPPATPVITASGPTTFCAGGSVTLTAPTGFTYAWSNGATTQSISVTTSGSYSVTVTNAGGCSATSAAATVTVNSAPATPVVTASGPTTFCAGGSVTLTAPTGFTYGWSNGASSRSIVVASAGTFTVTVTDAAGCSATSTPVTVATAPPPAATITAPASAPLGSLQTATVSAGPAGTSYQWTISGGSIADGQGTAGISFTVDSPDGTTLGVKVTLNGCSATGSATVSADSTADLSLSKSGPASASYGDAVTYTLTATNNGPLAANNVVIIDTTPAGLTLVSVSGACSAFPCDLGTISSGGTAVVTAKYTINLNAPDTVTNTALIGSSVNDPTPSNNTATATTKITGCNVTAPQPLAPIAGARVSSPVAFSWTPVTGASQYDVFQVGSTGNVKLGTATAPATTLTANVLTGPLTWFVVATLPCGTVQSATATANSCNAPIAPTPSVVANAASGQSYDLIWNAVADAGSYEVDESSGEAFASPSTQTVTGTTVTFTHSETTAPGVYFYRIRAVSVCDPQLKGPYSAVVRVVVTPIVAGTTPSANVPAGSTQIVIQEVFIPGLPDGNYLYVATVDRPWMSLDLPTGTLTPAGITLRILADPTTLPNGTFTGTLILALTPVSTNSNRARTSGGTTISVPVSVNLVTPVTPTTKTATAANALIIPSVGHLDGINSQWRSDIRLANVGFAKQQYALTFTPPSATSTTTTGSVKTTTITVDAGATTALDDIVRNWYGVGSLGEASNGVLEIRPLSVGANSDDARASAVSSPGVSLTTVVSSRTYNASTAGTLGQYIPAIPFSSFIGKAAQGALATVLNLQQVAQSDAYRTNIGVVEAAGASAAVTLSAYDDAGKKLTDYSMTLNPYQQVQLNSFLSSQGITLNDGRVEVKVTGGDGKVTAYASVVDNRTNDPLLVSGVPLAQTATNRYILPGVAALNNGVANWQTDMRIFNTGAAPQFATLSLYPLNGGAPFTASTTINPDEVKLLDGVVQSLFKQSNVGGALHITTENDSTLLVTGRTYNQTSSGTYGQFVPAVTLNDAVGSGARALNILQVEDSPRYRTNLGIAEVSGSPATVQIMVFLPDSKVTPKIEIPLAAFEYRQFPIIQSLGLGNIYNARINVQVISGSGKITAYGSVIDQLTQDPTYVPAQ